MSGRKRPERGCYMFFCHVVRRGYDNPKRNFKIYFKNFIVNIFIFPNFIPFIYFKVILPLQAHIRNICVMKKTGRRIYKTALSGRGSASVEAAMVLPVFIFAMLGIVSVAGAVHTRGIVYEGLHETALYMAEYSFLERQIENGVDAGAEAEVFKDGVSLVTANKKLRDYIEDQDMIDRYVAGSFAGLHIVQSELKADDCIYVKLEYDIRICVLVIGDVTIPCEERIRQRAFLGYDKANDADSEGTYVYVAENGEVYHKSRSCFHIKLNIRQISYAAAEKECEGLTQCSLCARYRGRGTLYVTQSGDKYHYSLECPGLKRTVYRVKKDDAGDMRPCSNCGEGGSEDG